MCKLKDSLIEGQDKWVSKSSHQAEFFDDPDFDTQEDIKYQDEGLDLGNEFLDQKMDFAQEGGMVL